MIRKTWAYEVGKCSVCNELVVFSDRPAFCPYCGANADKELTAEEERICREQKERNRAGNFARPGRPRVVVNGVEMDQSQFNFAI
jgi:NADH pyrophosphatase NudC (nudix superfamily)